MAKPRETINAFHGGIVRSKHVRDLDKTEASDIVDLTPSIIGSLISSNIDFKADATTWDTIYAKRQVAGYGAFSFEADYDLDNVAASTIIICFTNDDTANTLVRFTDGEVYASDDNAVTTWTDHDGKAVFYAVNGNVRFSDATLSNTANTVTWFGVCPQKFQDDNYFLNESVRWRQTDNHLQDPDACLLGTGSAVLPSSQSTIQHGLGFGLEIVTSSGNTTGKWAVGVYEFAGSHMYLENQESKLTTFSATHTVTDANRLEHLEPVLWTTVPDASGHNAAARQTGGRIYWRRNNRSWKLFLDFDYVLGVRDSLDSDYTVWSALTSGGYKNNATISIAEPYPITYESLNGHRSGDVHALSFGESAAYAWQTAVVAQSRAWVANVAYKDENGVTKTMGDRILYTPPNKYDIFPSTYWLDIGANDGENFTALIEHSGFLFAFKNNTLYIINIQSPVEAGWRVQNKLPHYGVSAPYQVCRTKDGIYWVNGEGVYLWSGGKVSEISLKVYPDIISSLSDNSAIGYDVVNRDIIVRANCTGTDASLWKFHTPTQSWYQATLQNAFVQSNYFYRSRALRWFIEDGSQDQYYMGIKEETAAHTDNATTTFKYVTRDIDFGNVGFKKKVYAFTITYSVTNTSNAIEFKYATDGGSLGSAADLPAIASDASPQRHKFTTPLICQSFQLEFNASGNSNAIAIQDISIEYRILRSGKVT